MNPPEAIRGAGLRRPWFLPGIVSKLEAFHSNKDVQTRMKPSVLRFLIFFLFCYLWPFLCWAQAQLDIPTLRKGVVKITSSLDNKKQTGTGFIVARGKKHVYVVTAYHVISFKKGTEEESLFPAETIGVTFYTYQEEVLPAKVVQQEAGSQGLALLKVGGDLPDDIQLLEWGSTAPLHGGERVDLIGFPTIGSKGWFPSSGTYGELNGRILHFTGAVEEGNSGGPIFYEGKVIGVVVEVRGQFGRAIPARIAQLTVENWPGYPRSVMKKPVHPSPPEDPVALGEPSSGSATFVITSTPAFARVYVDDQLVGETGVKSPLVINDVEPDEYDIRVSKSGFQDWVTTVEVMPGESREFNVSLREGTKGLEVTGVWQNPMNPSISYVLKQVGQNVTMSEVTTSVLGSVITAEGQGQMHNNQLFLRYRTAIGTMGESQATLSSDGQQLVGTFKDFSTNIPMALSLFRTAHDPSSFSSTGNNPFNSIGR